MSRQIRIVQRDDPDTDIHDMLADQDAWGEQPPSHVPGEILIDDHSKAEEILAEARRRGKMIIERKSAIVAVGAAVVGVSSAIGAAAWWASHHESRKKRKKSPAQWLSDFRNAKK